ncbi:hypothetical protein [Methylovirgula sp. 4M-Z18]|uniref:hypothetical protein n=1 Tax=Methylovirgula sp. 4M-Z18 TaxID=2293567 RepID=UPI000E2ED7A0|nr:hypothetical protein [Methylovirgula sp. 4M-Z18]RFB79284.1 hypothetical protein DYH55_11990 [Methylovirgula sp. 4M-Z18]
MSFVALRRNGVAEAGQNAPAKRRAFRKLTVWSAGTLVFAVFAAGCIDRLSAPPAVLPAATSAADAEDNWVPADEPVRQFGFEADPAAAYDVRLNTASGGRMDTLSLGRFGAADGYSRLTVYRPGDEALPTSSLFVDMARRASDAGFAVLRDAVPFAFQTRFGAFEAAEIMVSDGKVNTSCLGFRRAAVGEPVLIDGFTCGDQTPDAARTACLIDGLRLASADEDPTLQAFFAPSTQQPTLCPTDPPAVAEAPSAQTEPAPLPPERRAGRWRHRVVR